MDRKIDKSEDKRMIKGLEYEMTSLISILLIMYLNLNFVELLCCPVYFQWDISGMIAILVDILMLLLNLYSEPLRLKFGNGPKK